MEPKFTGPSFTIGIEEELMILDSESLALANAIVRADKWIAKASATDVAKVVPEEYLLGDRALYLFSYDKVKEAISPDGMISDAGAQATLKALSTFDPNIKGSTIELEKTYTNEFAKKANSKYK